MKPFGIKNLHVESFRAMKDVDIPIGQRLTVIAGQNSTGKSTILGMLGQPFGMTGCKTILDKSFRTKFSDIFNFSPDHDVPGSHRYRIDFRDVSICGKEQIPVKSYKRENAKSHIRLVTGDTRGKGDGNVDYPVIYMGLRRTYPVGELTSPKSSNPELAESEIIEFESWYQRTMVPVDEPGLSAVRIKQDTRKDTLLINSQEYDYWANSAGQDNVGQLLAALLSFERLSGELGDEYKGGLLLIDELDVTLFPAAQARLLDILFEESQRLRLQIVFTTHSISLIEHAIELRDSTDDVSIAYLRNLAGRITVNPTPSMTDITADLNIKPLPPKPKQKKIEVWCEDDEAAWLLRKICSHHRIGKKTRIVSSGLSCGELGNLATKDLDSLEYLVFVVDGDSNKNATARVKQCERRLVLPGGEKSPEQSMFDILDSIPGDHSFWENDRLYTKQVFKSRYEDSRRISNGSKERVAMKKWFKEEKGSGLWGNNGDRIYALWSDQYEAEIDDFRNKLEAFVDKLIRRRDAMAKMR